MSSRVRVEPNETVSPVNRHGPIASVRLVHLTEASEQRAHVVPLNVVIQRVTKEFLGGDAVVMVQLDRHRQPLQPDRDIRPSSALSTHLGGAVKECDEFDVLGHGKQVKYSQVTQDKAAP